MAFKAKVLKAVIKIVFPIVGAGIIIAGVLGTVIITNNKNNPIGFPKKITLASPIKSVNADTTKKIVVDNPIILNVEPSNSIKNYTWKITSAKDKEKQAPNLIYINNNNQLVVDKGLDKSYDQTEWLISVDYQISYDIHQFNSSENSINFKINLNSASGDVVKIDWQIKGDTSINTIAGETKYAVKPWLAKIQSKEGEWSLAKVNYQIISKETDIDNYVAIDENGFLYTLNSKKVYGKTLNLKIRAISNENSSFYIDSDNITINFSPDESQIARLEFVNSMPNIAINVKSKFISQMPFIVKAYSKDNFLIPNPQITFYSQTAPKFVDIDTYGYLHINALNIETPTSLSFDLLARSNINPQVQITTNIKVSILDSKDSRYQFDDNSQTLLGFTPIGWQWMKNQPDGKIELPDTIDGKDIKNLADNLFRNNLIVKSLTLPKNLTSIGSNCFYGASNLTKINIFGNPDINTSSFTTGNNLNLVINDSNFVNKLKQGLITEQETTGEVADTIGEQPGNYAWVNSGINGRTPSPVKIGINYSYISNLNNWQNCIIWDFNNTLATSLNFDGSTISQSDINDLNALANNSICYISKTEKVNNIMMLFYTLNEYSYKYDWGAAREGGWFKFNVFQRMYEQVKYTVKLGNGQGIYYTEANFASNNLITTVWSKERFGALWLGDAEFLYTRIDSNSSWIQKASAYAQMFTYDLGKVAGYPSANINITNNTWWNLFESGDSSPWNPN